jgi:hypothetical protein
LFADIPVWNQKRDWDQLKMDVMVVDVLEEPVEVVA